MADVILSQSIRNNLLSLQSTADMMSTAQNRLATGKKVNSALDDPRNFFVASGLNNRGKDLSRLLDDMTQGTKVLDAADKGITALQKLVESAQATVRQAQQSALSTTPTQVTSTTVGLTRSTLLTSAALGQNDATDIINLRVGSGSSATNVAFTVTATTTLGDLIDAINVGTNGRATASLDAGGAFEINSSTGEALAITLTDTSNTHVNTTTTLLGVGSTASVAASATTYSTTRASLEAQYTSLLTQMTQLSKDAGYNGTNLLGGNNLKVVFNEKGTAFLTIAGVTLDSAGLGLNAPTTGDFQVDANLSNLETALASASSTLRSQASTFGSNLSVVQNRLDFTKGLINALTTGADALVLADTNEEGANLLALQTRQQLSQTALSLSNQAQQGVLRLFS
jgi:flagellin-like hook-associated protein FlgL